MTHTLQNRRPYKKSEGNAGHDGNLWTESCLHAAALNVTLSLELALVPSPNMEGEGLMNSPAARQKGAMQPHMRLSDLS